MEVRFYNVVIVGKVMMIHVSTSQRIHTVASVSSQDFSVEIKTQMFCLKNKTHMYVLLKKGPSFRILYYVRLMVLNHLFSNYCYFCFNGHVSERYG